MGGKTKDPVNEIKDFKNSLAPVCCALHFLVDSHQELVFSVSLPGMPKTLVFWVRGYPKHSVTPEVEKSRGN